MIRRATTEDIHGIRKMAEVVFRDTYKDILSPEQMEYMMDMMYSEESLTDQMTRKGHIYFLDEGRGYASYRFDGCTDNGVKLFHLEKLYVMPDCRHTGLGLDLFSTVVKNVRKWILYE